MTAGTANQESVDAVVVGGGIAGLTAAYELTLAGLRPLVLEARGYTGGLIADTEIAGLRLDIGAEAWAVRRPEVGELVAELGLEPEPPGGASWVRGVDGRTVPIPARAMLGVPQDPRDEDVVHALGQAAAARAARDLEEPMSEDDAERLGGGDLGALVGERMGAAVVDALVRPIAGGIHGADPSRLSAGAVLPGIPGALRETGSLARAVGLLRSRAPQGPAVASVRGGMALLTRTLAARVREAGGEVRVRAGAQGLRRVDGEPRWEVAVAATQMARRSDGSPNPSAEPVPVPGGRTTAVRTSRVVIAGGASVATRLFRDIATEPLPELALTPGSPVTHLTMIVDHAGLDAAPRGSGMLVAPGVTEVRAKALTHLTVKWPSLGERARASAPHRHALRMSYGRSDDPATDVDLPTAAADASELLGVAITEDDVRDHRIIRWGGALAPATPEARATTAALDRRVAADPTFAGVRLAGAWVAGTGIAAIVPHARQAARALA